MDGTTAALVAATIVGGLLAMALVWWLASRRWQLPMPYWVGLLVDDPLIRFVSRPDTTIDRVGIHAGQRVLEVGPGTGRLTLAAARRLGPEGELVCLDIQPAMIAHLNRVVEENHLTNVVTQVGDVTEPHFASSSFDVAFLVTVLGEIPDRKRALAELCRVLRPGGILSVTEVLVDTHYVPYPTLRRLAEGQGFSLAERKGPFWACTANFRAPGK